MNKLIELGRASELTKVGKPGIEQDPQFPNPLDYTRNAID